MKQVLKVKPCFISDFDWVKTKHNDIEIYYNKEIIRGKVLRSADVIIRDKIYRVESGEYEFSVM